MGVAYLDQSCVQFVEDAADAWVSVYRMVRNGRRRPRFTRGRGGRLVVRADLHLCGKPGADNQLPFIPRAPHLRGRRDLAFCKPEKSGADEAADRFFGLLDRALMKADGVFVRDHRMNRTK
jgi:hypothetical protein